MPGGRLGVVQRISLAVDAEKHLILAISTADDLADPKQRLLIRDGCGTREVPLGSGLNERTQALLTAKAERFIPVVRTAAERQAHAFHGRGAALFSVLWLVGDEAKIGDAIRCHVDALLHRTQAKGPAHRHLQAAEFATGNGPRHMQTALHDAHVRGAVDFVRKTPLAALTQPPGPSPALALHDVGRLICSRIIEETIVVRHEVTSFLRRSLLDEIGEARRGHRHGLCLLSDLKTQRMTRIGDGISIADLAIEHLQLRHATALHFDGKLGAEIGEFARGCEQLEANGIALGANHDLASDQACLNGGKQFQSGFTAQDSLSPTIEAKDGRAAAELDFARSETRAFMHGAASPLTILRQQHGGERRGGAVGPKEEGQGDGSGCGQDRSDMSDRTYPSDLSHLGWMLKLPLELRLKGDVIQIDLTSLGIASEKLVELFRLVGGQRAIAEFAEQLIHASSSSARCCSTHLKSASRMR